MRHLTTDAATTTLTLDEVVARLAARPIVAGILFHGSTGTERMHPASDYDLLVVFESLPAPLRMVMTWVDDRLTEVYCTTTLALARLRERPGAFALGSDEGTLVTWLRSGRIAFDRNGVLGAAQAFAQTAPPSMPQDEQTIYDRWRSIGYNIAHAKRYLAASQYLAVEMRLLYSLTDLMTGYFILRRLLWDGEKSAIRYWTDHDPVFLAAFRACLAETDVRRKVERYEEVARLVVAPVGALWTFGTTAVAIGPAYGMPAEPGTDPDPSEALAVWDALTLPI